MSGRSRRLAEQQRRQQRLILGVGGVVTLLVAVLLVVLISGRSTGPTSPPEPTLTVSMVEMAFDPDPIEAAAGEAVLRVVNDGLLPHSLVVPAVGKGTPDLGPGAEMVLDLTSLDPGEYYVFCDIAGHLEAGMETTLVLG